MDKSVFLCCTCTDHRWTFIIHLNVAQYVYSRGAFKSQTSESVRFKQSLGGEKKLTFFSDDVYQDVDDDERSRPPDPGTEHITGCFVSEYMRVHQRNQSSNFSKALPAVHGDRPGVQDALLLQVDLLQEVQHAAGVGGDAVVGPGPEVVLPDGALRVALEPHRTNCQ